MAEFPALPLFTDAYMADTRHLTTLQHGAYLLLLMTAWRMPDCALSNDDNFLARICGMDRRTWNNNKHTILAFWSLSAEQKWEQGRLKDERNYVEQLSNKNSNNAKVRWLKNKKSNNANALPNSCQTDAPTPTPTPTPNIRGDKSPLTYSAPFLEFWAAYPPNSGSKKSASDSYNVTTKKGIPHELLVRKANEYAVYVGAREDGRRFTKHAATWINQQCWETDYAIGRSPGGAAGGTSSPIAGRPALAGSNTAAGAPRPSRWITEGERLAAKYREQAQRERQGAVEPLPGPSLRLAAPVREDGGGTGNAG